MNFELLSFQTLNNLWKLLKDLIEKKDNKKERQASHRWYGDRQQLQYIKKKKNIEEGKKCFSHYTVSSYYMYVCM